MRENIWKVQSLNREMKRRSSGVYCLFLFLAFICSTVNARAIEYHSVELSCDEAVAEGIKNSPQIQIAEAQLEEKAWGRVGFFSGLLPHFSMSAQHFFSAQYQYLNTSFGGNPTRFPMVFPNTSVSASAQWVLFDGFQSWNRYQSALLRAEAASAQLAWVKLQVRQEIRERFYQAIAAQELQRVVRENVRTMEDHLNQVRLFKKGGSATHYDLLRVEVQKSEAESELLQAEDQFYLARQKLAVSMGLHEDQRALQGSLPDPHLKIMDQFRPDEGSQRADVQAEEKTVESSHRAYLAERSFWVPKVSVGAQYTRYGQLSYNAQTSTVQDPHQYQNAYQVGIFLNWNLFDGLNSLAKARQSFYQEVQSEQQLALNRLKIPYDFELWKRKYRYSAALYSAKKVEILKAQESVRLAQEGYRAGIRTNTEVLDAELEWFRARAGMVNAQLSCAEAFIHLELAAGRTLISQQD